MDYRAASSFHYQNPFLRLFFKQKPALFLFGYFCVCLSVLLPQGLKSISVSAESKVEVASVYGFQHSQKKKKIYISIYIYLNCSVAFTDMLSIAGNYNSFKNLNINHCLVKEKQFSQATLIFGTVSQTTFSPRFISKFQKKKSDGLYQQGRDPTFPHFLQPEPVYCFNILLWHPNSVL